MKIQSLLITSIGILAALSLTACTENPLLIRKLDGDNVTVIEIDPDSDEYQPTMQVLVVVDNSRSMQDEQEALAQGVRRMIEGLYNSGAKAEFSIYTTSSENASGAQKPVVKLENDIVIKNPDGSEEIPTR